MPLIMSSDSFIISQLREAVCGSVKLFEQGKDRYRILTPFAFHDGDRFCPVLKKVGARWIYTDDGSTFMRLAYRLSDDFIMSGARGRIIEQALLGFGLTNVGGVLSLVVDGDDFGSALYGFTQAILRISDVTLWNKQSPKSTFAEDFQKTVRGAVPTGVGLEFNWSDKIIDPKKHYTVDCRLAAQVPVFMFGVQNDEKCDSATIVIQHYRRINQRFSGVIIYESQEEIGRKHVARLSDVADKQFSSLPTPDGLREYLDKLIAA